VTPVGRILRRLNLDELPQLINVIRGEMSLVGPRIVAASELENCASRTDFDKSMRPGMTGLWKVNGCNDLSAQVALDEHYVRNWSIILDLWILFRSLRVASTKMFAR
jgi:lipopolysaccharide/colanic/teichoic acid biosynthesis glycosyltransferase